MPNNGGYVNGIAWSGDTLFASTLSDGLYSSTDGGMTWHAATSPRRPPGTSGSVALPPRIASLATTGDGELVIGTSVGVFHLLDGGRGWLSFGPEDTIGKE